MTEQVAAPSRFRRVVDKIIHIETVVLLTIFYFTVFGLTAIILRLFGKELLPSRDPRRKSYWYPYPEKTPDLGSMKRQF